MRKITILGSTGSVGTQALETAQALGCTVTAIAAASNIMLLEDQIRRFRPELCGVTDEKAARELALRIADTPTKVISGAQSAAEAAAYGDTDTVINAVSGIAGLRPTLAAIESKKTLALANKESLVTAGELVMGLARDSGVEILPVDSEHSAIAQCLRGNRREDMRRILLTCSGGPFYGLTRDKLSNMPAETALRHPTWKMGAKITIDSATLMNKGFEVIEAAQLFGVGACEVRDKIEVVVHRESIIHSMVEFCDGSVIAQLSSPDMRLPVMYALCGERRGESVIKPLDFKKLSSLSFGEADTETFLPLEAAYAAYEAGGTIPCALNGANEAAVEMYLAGKIGFTDILDIAVETVSHFNGYKTLTQTLENVEKTDAEAREFVRACYMKTR